MTTHTVKFLPDDIEIDVPEGKTILEAADIADIKIKSTCGGDGSCGRCAVLVNEGSVASNGSGNLSPKHKNQGYVLACKNDITGPATITVPQESRVTEEHQVLLEDNNLLEPKEDEGLNKYEFSPLGKAVAISLEEPTLTENTDDTTRLLAEFKKATGYSDVKMELPILKNLGSTLRESQWNVTVTYIELDEHVEIVNVDKSNENLVNVGLAIDIGTTTVVVNAINLETGKLIDSQGSYNRQVRYGDDVITRIVHASDEKNGLQDLQSSVLGALNELIDKIIQKNDLKQSQISTAMVAGNTTMTHMFLGVDPKYIRLEPYIPTFSSVPPIKAKDIGLTMNPEGYIFNFSSVASYVGGDIVSGTLFTDITKSDEIILFIDIGTNGEMVLGNNEWMVCCACSAGPAFEGGGITHGMRAAEGAIERVEVDTSTYEVNLKTIGNKKPTGICGSGLIDGLAKLRQAGIIDRSGNFNQEAKTDRLRTTDDDVEFVLAWKEDAGIDSDVVLTENDIKNVIRSKGAIYAGIKSMLGLMELDETIISKIIIAGGFGNYLNIEDSIQIGLLPDIPREKYEFIGNSSVKGAKQALLSKEAWKEAEFIGNAMTYLELSVGNLFMDEFVSALFLPHTDLNQFPSVSQ